MAKLSLKHTGHFLRKIYSAKRILYLTDPLLTQSMEFLRVQTITNFSHSIPKALENEFMD